LRRPAGRFGGAARRARREGWNGGRAGGVRRSEGLRRARPQGRRPPTAHHLRHLLLQRARFARATEEGRMKNLLAAFVLVLCAAFAGTSAGACRDPGGIGGTGIVPGGTGGTGVDPGGTGGTGVDPGGIGGTGQRAEAEIGVLGVITGFGSICVNGIEVHYDANTHVALNGDLSSASALGIGQVVSVLAV